MTKPERREFDRGPRAHYFTEDRTPAVKEGTLSFAFKGHEFTFESGSGVFSKDRADTGSRILLQEFCKNERPAAGARILDLGCGYGLIGIVLAGVFTDANVDFVEINAKAAKFAARNAKNNGLGNVSVHAIDFTDATQRDRATGGLPYDYILLNPPVKAGKRVTRALVDAALDSVRAGGAMYIVLRTSLGAKAWQATFEGRQDVHLDVFRESGYRVFKLAVKPAMGATGGDGTP
ncbi:MAG: methyltransferase [Candidatus Lokiarchaeota archaeon]|nr:methyltransferase [Candidatus Lokiarchaeota archaeon]